MTTRRPAPAVVAAVVLPVLLGLLTGCRAERQPAAAEVESVPSSAAPSPSADPLIGAVATAPDVVASVQRTLDHRARAVLTHDLAGYRDGLVPRDAAFVAGQEQYFRNLLQLPLSVLTLTADPATLVRRGATYSVNVAVTLQLEGYDAAPVTSLDRYRFAPSADGRRYRLASVTDAAWEARNAVRSQPWDDGPIQVRSGAGVLGIFDEDSVAAAGPLLRSLESGIADVAARVPYEWSRSVVVYALSTDSFLASLPDLPGGDPDELDAVAFPVTTDAAQPASPLAATRLVLNPAMLDRTGPTRDRLLRHELTHAAVGTHDDHVPVWLSEGIAEQVSAHGQAPEDRAISKRALAAARAGFTALPGDAEFNDADAAAHYGLAWWACEYVATTAGPSAVWALLDQLEALGAAGTLDATSEDATLVAVAGVNARTLARKAGKLMLATFEPPPPVPTYPPGIDPLTGLPSPAAPTVVPVSPASPVA